MLNLALFLKCFLIGAIGIGASVADALLFMLGLTGALTLLASVTQFKGGMYAIGMLVLAWLGYNALRVRHVETRGPNLPARSLPLAALKSFFITISSPLAIIYFMSASVALLHNTHFSAQLTSIAGAVVGLGTFSVLAIVSLAAKFTRHRISERMLLRVSHVTGTLFLCFAAYFAYLLVRTMFTLLGY